MERDLGLDTLSEDERVMIYAITSVTDAKKSTFLSSDIKKHILCGKMSNPTFYRNLKRLLERGIIKNAHGKKTGLYEVADDALFPAMPQA
ncbi:MAG: hypothetical protein QNK42_02340 [Pseudodonghicola sp.]|nr:hypothetical protein [Pseudodonghicola sp.]